MLSNILNLIFIFFTALLLGFLFLFLGYIISPKDHKKDTFSEKFQTYFCGEKFVKKISQVNIQRFFLYISLFMIFDIVAFLLALSYNTNNFFPILFIIIISFSLIPIVWREKK